MKLLKALLNFINVIEVTSLCVLLILLLILSPVISAVSNITKPETISKILTSIDYEKVLSSVDKNSEPDVDEPEISDEAITDIIQNDVIENLGIPTEVVTDLMNSSAMDDIIQLYTKDIDTVLTGKDEELSFTPEAVKGILTENIDEFTDIVIETLPEGESANKEEVKQLLLKNLDESAESISSFLPNVNEIIPKDTNSQIMSAVRFVQKGTLALVFWIIVAVLSLIIFFSRAKRFKGFIWLGVVYLLSGVLLLIAKGNIVSLLTEKLASSIPFSVDIILPALNVMLSYFTTIGIISIVLSVLFVGGFIAIKVCNSKRTAPVVPISFEENATEPELNVDNDVILNAQPTETLKTDETLGE